MKKKEMEIYEVEFSPMYPVGHVLIIAAESRYQAKKIAEKTVTHAKIEGIKKVNIQKPRVITYLSGNY